MKLVVTCAACGREVPFTCIGLGVSRVISIVIDVCPCRDSNCEEDNEEDNIDSYPLKYC